MSTGPHVIHWKLRASAASAASAPPVAASAWSTIQWEGSNHLTTLELKRHIVQQLPGLADSEASFDFILHNASTGEEYKDDNFIVHRNTSVHVRRINATRQRAQQLQIRPTTGLSAATTAAAAGAQGDSDEQQILALVNTASRSTRPSYSSAPPASYGPQQYQRASHGVRAEGAGRGSSEQYSANSRPPPSYVCHRCGQGGHFIRYCPTNGDPAYDGRRPKAALAVQQYEQNAQKIFLRDVEDPKANRTHSADAADGRADDRHPATTPLAHTTQSNYAVNPSYDRDSFRPSDDSAATEARLASRPDLLCPIDHRVFDEPTVVPCCFASFCRHCIERSLLQSSLCPRCKQPLDGADLRPNLGLQKKIQQEREGGARQQPNGYAAAGASMPPPARRPYEESGYESRRDGRRGYGGVEERVKSPPRYERRPDERYDGRDRQDERDRGGRNTDRERDYRRQDAYPPAAEPPRDNRYPTRPPPTAYPPPTMPPHNNATPGFSAPSNNNYYTPPPQPHQQFDERAAARQPYDQQSHPPPHHYSNGGAPAAAPYEPYRGAVGGGGNGYAQQYGNGAGGRY